MEDMMAQPTEFVSA